jgi:hypothetical protein
LRHLKKSPCHQSIAAGYYLIAWDCVQEVYDGLHGAPPALILPLLEEKAAQQEVCWRTVRSQVDSPAQSLQGLYDRATLVLNRGKEEKSCGVESIQRQHGLAEVTSWLQVTLVGQSTSLLQHRHRFRQAF